MSMVASSFSTVVRDEGQAAGVGDPPFRPRPALGALLAGMSELPALLPQLSPCRRVAWIAPHMSCRRGRVAQGGCAGGISTATTSGALLVAMSPDIADRLTRLGTTASTPTGADPARRRGVLDRGADAAPRRLMLRPRLTPCRACVPARGCMTTKTKSIARDTARLLLRASAAPPRADICQSPLARSRRRLPATLAQLDVRAEIPRPTGSGGAA